MLAEILCIILLLIVIRLSIDKKIFKEFFYGKKNYIDFIKYLYNGNKKLLNEYYTNPTKEH